MTGGEFRIIDRAPRVDQLLEPFRAALGADYNAYRGHVLRVLTYAMHFLNGDETWRPAIETALVYHDIGLWSDNDLGYLEPSIARVVADNTRENWGFDPGLLTALIAEHHKVFPYRGPYQTPVEAVRRADWVDASGGLIRHGLAKSDIAATVAAIPVNGFPNVLMRLAADLAGGNQMRGLMRVLTRVYRW